MKKRNYELLVIIFFLILGCVLFGEALPNNVLGTAFAGEYTKPYDIPMAIVAISMILCIVLLVKNIRERVKESRNAKESRATDRMPDTKEEAAAYEASNEEKIKKRKVVLTLLLIIAYVIIWKFAGFYIATPIFVFADCMVLPDKRSAVKSLLTAAATTAVCYVVFTIMFQIRFPSPF